MTIGNKVITDSIPQAITKPAIYDASSDVSWEGLDTVLTHAEHCGLRFTAENLGAVDPLIRRTDNLTLNTNYGEVV